MPFQNIYGLLGLYPMVLERQWNQYANSLSHRSEIRNKLYFLIFLKSSLGHALSEYIWFVGSISYIFGEAMEPICDFALP